MEIHIKLQVFYLIVEQQNAETVPKHFKKIKKKEPKS